MYVNLNDSELTEAYLAHCGTKADKCPRCKFMEGRAKIIRWQKNDMWKRFKAGYYNMNEADQRRYDDDNRSLINFMRKKRESEKAAIIKNEQAKQTPVPAQQ